jgi:ubiquinone/menaquinone biosynthesis C-methylase UbiE
MFPVDPAVVRHYEAIREEDRISFGIGQLEFVRVQEVLRRHLPDPPASIVDIGGATGVHASWLADQGYRVQILDITPRHVEKANADLSGKGVQAHLGDARSLPYPDATFDAALLFGPLYHLTDGSDRTLALREATRVVRQGGIVAVAAVSRFASLFDGLGRQFLFDPEFIAIARNDLDTGQHRNPSERPHWWTTAYLHHPDQLRWEADQAGLQVREIVGVEGLAGYLPQLADRWDNAEDRETILWAARAIETESTLLGLSAHLLLLAERPSARLDSR